MADDPFAGDVLKLEGEAGRWRRRVGNYRIFFSVDAVARAVSVSAILRRTSTTY
jgi:mRNA-degrading endonuclease RelE of RelBE toxin-antitoxin system